MPSTLHRNLELEVNPSVKLPDFGQDVLEGLSQSSKRLPCVYFYDRRGSELFERISELPEYYLTRTEFRILKNHSVDIAGYSSGGAELVELGSGSSSKTRLLIEALLARQGSLVYRPIDISKSMLVSSARNLLSEYSGLDIKAHAGDYQTGIRRIADLDHQKIVVFLGSSIGNFEPDAARDFLAAIRQSLNSKDLFLLGTDMRKDPQVLEAAYNDSQGVTALFNLNLLRRINSELGGRFDLSHFRHVAFFNSKEGRVEMHLDSRIAQVVYIAKLGRSFRFEEGERIHTENSYKYTEADIAELSRDTGFEVIDDWRDPRDYFRLSLLRPV